jgi:MerR family transcriptional regulator, redox-sensitive transcriptional activator SoxR
MLIGELSRRAGIAPSAIRYYEDQGLLPRAGRVSGRRVFDDRSLANLMVVRLAGDAGFTLAEIRQLVTEFGKNRWRRLAQRKLGEIQAASERLRSMTVLLEKLLECKCPDIEFCGKAIEKSAAAARPRRSPLGARSVRG